MPRWLSLFLKRRAESRRAIVTQARTLVDTVPKTAYYYAHRLATRARVCGDWTGLLFWGRVAVEVARRSDAPMDQDELRRILEDEECGAWL